MKYKKNKKDKNEFYKGKNQVIIGFGYENYKFTCGCKFRVKFKSIDFIGFEDIFF